MRHLSLLFVALTACHARAPAEVPAEGLPSETVTGLDAALAKITVDSVRRDVEKLSSDELLGRAPGTEGETRTLAYLRERFHSLGLTPAGDSGSYASKVPLLGAISAPSATFATGTGAIDARYPDDFVLHSRTGQADVSLPEAPLVFAGYGIVAPEFGWDDYAGLDAKGKVIVVLAGDPPITRADGQLDEAVFGGHALTYYGRWTYKYEAASQKGAAGLLIVHETGAAGYGYDVVKSGAQKEQLMLVEDSAVPRVGVEGWLSEPFARRLLTAAGADYDALKAGALRREASVALNATASLAVHSTLRRFDSHNALAVLPGGDLASEAVVLSAHWDHFGHDAGREGDGIFNGAIDNASGVASMLAIAEALAALPERPRRSIVLLAPTAEESGLLGAKYYANHPFVPLANTVANVNMDCMNLWGRAHALVSVGLGTSSLDDVLAAEVARVGRVVVGDAEPEKGYFFRSDHLEFVRKGVPALHFLHPGDQYEGKTAEQSAALRKAYVTENYHKVSDQVSSALVYEGAVDDARLLTRVVLDVANTTARPVLRRKWVGTGTGNDPAGQGTP